MAGNAAGITDEEAMAAAEYFSSMKMTPWIKVVEDGNRAEDPQRGRLFRPAGRRRDGDRIGQRILEMPVDPEATETYRNPRSGWIAYVPMGSVKKGEDLVVRGGAGKTVACAACHGEGLKGNGNFPPLAGRSPSYLARQLYDIQQLHAQRPGDPADAAGRSESDAKTTSWRSRPTWLRSSRSRKSLCRNSALFHVAPAFRRASALYQSARLKAGATSSVWYKYCRPVQFFFLSRSENHFNLPPNRALRGTAAPFPSRTEWVYIRKANQIY